ncbi:KIAA1958 [Branchiostoma lanceolatum]|uniref:KIAA1958 protein n=1 Tax=Branchiostoma lanceolatum TaxID=7740 RepID=A0A8J9VLT9_BRALA|nr:KIAA1958 [Branchiostoma lanceolatum]
MATTSQEEFGEKSETPDELGEECSDEEYSMTSSDKDVKAQQLWSNRRRKQLCAHNYPVKWAANAYQAWAEQENRKLSAKQPAEKFLAPTDWSKATPEEANFWVSKYLTEVRKQDGTPYTPSTLQTLAHGLDHHIKEDLGINYLDLMSNNLQFADVRNALVNQKQLFGHLEGISKYGVKEFTQQDEVKLWRTVFDLNTPQGLLYAVYYHNCKLFGVWTGEEHHSLTVSQFSFGQDNKGQFVKFIRQGRRKKDQGKAYTYHAVPGNPWCVVGLYRLYLSKIPPGGHFYFRPAANQNPLSYGSHWYSTQPIGHNHFATIMAKLAEMIGLEGRYTPASACKKRPLRGDLPSCKRQCSHEHVPVPTVHGTTCTLAQVNIAPKSSSVHSAAAASHSSGSAGFTEGATNPSLSEGNPALQQMFMLVPVASSLTGTGDIDSLPTNMWNYLSNVEESSSGTPRKKRNRKRDRYSCPEDGCDRTFRDKYEMTNHLRTHTGEKPFKCDWPG